MNSKLALLASPLAVVVFLGIMAAQALAADDGPLTQKEAEQMLSRIYIQNCGPNAKFNETVKLAPPDKNGKVRDHYGPITAYTVQKTLSGSCTSHVIGRTDWANVDAKYTTSFYRNNFGDWTHTPVIGVCNYHRTAYQVDGEPKVQIPPDVLAQDKGSCMFGEKQ